MLSWRTSHLRGMWLEVLHHVHQKLCAFLQHAIPLDPAPVIHVGKEGGFAVSFSSSKSVEPFSFNFMGNYGVDILDGGHDEPAYPVVQGVLYVYICGQRVRATGKNHLDLVYKRTDGDLYQPMSGYTGESRWYMVGWKKDEYGEYEGIPEFWEG